MPPLTRRTFLAGSATVAAAPRLLRSQAAKPLYPQRNLPFHVAVINDEIGADFENSCRVAAQDFGLRFIELRTIGPRNISAVTDADIAAARGILAKYSLTVSDLASPLFKVEFPGARSVSGRTGPADTFTRQADVLEQTIHVARALGTNRIRCFDFLRLEDPAAARGEINEQLRKAAARAAKEDMVLLLENEQSCNTQTGAEAAATLAAVPNSNFMLNWDPGNAAESGEVPYPNGYNVLPKNRIGHCHCKDVTHGADGRAVWAPVGAGIIDWRGQIQALVNQRFAYTLSLETHWRGAGTAEESTRQSMAGLQKILAQVSA